VILSLFHKAWKGNLTIIFGFIKHLSVIFSYILNGFLLIGALFLPLFVPTEAKAGFFSSILGTQAYAKVDSANLTQNNNNSQTMPLLQANASMPVLSAKNDKESKKAVQTDKINESANVNIISGNALLPTASPTGTISGTAGTGGADVSSDQTSVYVIRKGDSISQIADMFGVSVNTILWGNDMKKGDKLVEGDVLFILPISGLEHTVAKGQTLKSIAALYKADINDILAYNDITPNTPLVVGDTLLIPDAQKSEENDKPVKNLGASIAKDNKYYESHPTKNLSGYYINPVPSAIKTQGLHDGNAVDLGAPTGTPIHAAASGIIIFAKVGNNGGYGNLTIISHSNGTETLYAHQSSIATSTGAEVSQGEVIGFVGSTGHSTGPHLHFAVKGARNPGADGSWAN
jgi:LysM repeat protein